MEAKPQCRFSVDDVVHMEGPCRIETTYDGSFTVRTAGTGPHPYAFVLMDGGLMAGFWSGSPPALSPHHALGPLSRQGDNCWVNARMTLCIAR